MNNRTYLLFDLDGTLTRSGDGIINAALYALESVGIHETDMEKMMTFIGPPLEESFETHYGFNEEESKALIAKYKEYYDEKGVYESAPYEEIPETLARLREEGYYITIASSKPQDLVDLVTDHFGLAEYFRIRCGATMDRTVAKKPDVIRMLLRKISEETGVSVEEILQKSVMMGDRKYDILGAHEVGIPCIGVSYGYAPEGELEEYGAERIASTPRDIIEKLKGL